MLRIGNCLLCVSVFVGMYAAISMGLFRCSFRYTFRIIRSIGKIRHFALIAASLSPLQQDYYLFDYIRWHCTVCLMFYGDRFTHIAHTLWINTLSKSKPKYFELKLQSTESNDSLKMAKREHILHIYISDILAQRLVANRIAKEIFLSKHYLVFVDVRILGRFSNLPISHEFIPQARAYINCVNVLTAYIA